MKLQVDFYKDTGKWYSGGIVDIPDFNPVIGNDNRSKIYKHQKIVHSPYEFYMIAKNSEDNGDFFDRLFIPNRV